MVFHHSFREHDQFRSCAYCRNDQQGVSWRSVHDSHLHYKERDCTRCGRVSRIRVDFIGSGHDAWDGTQTWLSYLGIREPQSSLHLNGNKK
ncbi:hypothetical protein J4464_00230 [Candidatus Woesearchaeota archaeon]|nr:hypothetical protein [Candidatus Woesearchaeota archaeon]